MKIYRIARTDFELGHDGYAYCTSRKAAVALAREGGYDVDTIRMLDVPLTKAGVMALLDQWASHADNG